MPCFLDVLPQIKKVAKRMNRLWFNKFEVNELVNEAWIRGKKYKNADAAFLVRRANLDMIDYIRECMGRQKYFINGEWVERKNKIPYFHTNIDSFSSCGKNEHSHTENILHAPTEDKNLLRFEHKELIVKALDGLSSSLSVMTVIKYYLEQKNLKQVGEEMGLSESTVSKRVKKSIRECQERMQTEYEFVSL